jgi:hypothetical protein
VAFTINLLKDDWFDRFGADTFRALILRGPATPNRLGEAIARLSQEACWPTQAVSASESHAKAADLVLPQNPQLGGFLSESCYLHAALQASEDVRELAVKSGAKPFTLSSLVRLRCVGEEGMELETKIEKGHADYRYPSYVAALSNTDRQAKMAAALTALSRHLSKANRADLRSTPSTLTATGELRAAEHLVRGVALDIWEVCPEPMANRLHPDLVAHRAIAGLCSDFNEEDWIASAASRARDGRIDDEERKALYAKLLADGTKMRRRALAALRESPVALNHRGEWTAPSAMVVLHAGQRQLMSPVVSEPSEALTARPHLLARLRIRDRLSGDDILACAQTIHKRPHMSQRFETLLDENQRLLDRTLVEQLKEIAFLRARSGKLARPSDLHIDTPAIRLCLEDEDRIVEGSNEAL